MFDEISKKTPMLANIRPSGQFVMEDFYYAGGLRALLAQIGDLLHGDVLTVNGKTMAENITGAAIHNPEVIRTRDNPVFKTGGTVVLGGNLAPGGAVIKPTAADPKLLKHTGKAVVFKDYDDLAARIDDESLDVDETSVLVLKHAGPIGGPGMPEWGCLPIPKKLLKKGIRDMVRISDARMSGTAFGAVVLHISPESYVGGPLALVQDGDLIELDVDKRKLHLHVSDEELAKRRAAWVAPKRHYTRGYGALVHRSRHAGRTRLRLRLPPGRRADAGAGYPLMSDGGDVQNHWLVTPYALDAPLPALARLAQPGWSVSSGVPSPAQRRR